MGSFGMKMAIRTGSWGSVVTVAGFLAPHAAISMATPRIQTRVRNLVIIVNPLACFLN
jgi:hypothetical protein